MGRLPVEAGPIFVPPTSQDFAGAIPSWLSFEHNHLRQAHRILSATTAHPRHRTNDISPTTTILIPSTLAEYQWDTYRRHVFRRSAPYVVLLEILTSGTKLTNPRSVCQGQTSVLPAWQAQHQPRHFPRQDRGRRRPQGRSVRLPAYPTSPPPSAP